MPEPTPQRVSGGVAPQDPELTHSPVMLDDDDGTSTGDVATTTTTTTTSSTTTTATTSTTDPSGAETGYDPARDIEIDTSSSLEAMGYEID